MIRYSGDPYWMLSKYPGACSDCGKSFPKLSRVFRYKTGAMYAEACGCGDKHSRMFEAMAADEEHYSHA